MSPLTLFIIHSAMRSLRIRPFRSRLSNTSLCNRRSSNSDSRSSLQDSPRREYRETSSSVSSFYVDFCEAAPRIKLFRS